MGCWVNPFPEREWAGQSCLASGTDVYLIPASFHPGWPCSMGTATSWTTCPSRSSTTFSRASCTSTPRASSHTAPAPLSPRPLPTHWPLQSLSVPLFLSCLSVLHLLILTVFPFADSTPHSVGDLQRPTAYPLPQSSLDKLSSRLWVGGG